ncbi:MAG: PilZ domain-containing protein [Phycisphaerae bacterium]|nr:PilZ domain-containing protein [Phycisphaerae bacterium]
MPANRSRTERWNEALQQVLNRGGALELILAGPDGRPPANGVSWRVRLLEVHDDHLLVEPPAAVGKTITLREDMTLSASYTIGQNRWVFESRTRGYRSIQAPRAPGVYRPGAPAGPAVGRIPGALALMIAPPREVTRSPRRRHDRVDASAAVEGVPVRCWPLGDPTAARGAEEANRNYIMELLRGGGSRHDPCMSIDEGLLIPDAGPEFRATLRNLSAGGLGLGVEPDCRRFLEMRRYFWLRLDLTPDIPAPIAVTAKIAHTHLEPTQHVHVGMAFDFTHNEAHRDFIVDLLQRYVEKVQDHLRSDAAARAVA